MIDLNYLFKHGPIFVILLPKLRLTDLLNLRKCSKLLSQSFTLKNEIEKYVLKEYFNFVPRHFYFMKLMRGYESSSKIFRTIINLWEVYDDPRKMNKYHKDFHDIFIQAGVCYGDIIGCDDIFDLRKSKDYDYIFLKDKFIYLGYCDKGKISCSLMDLKQFPPNTYHCHCSKKCFVGLIYRNAEDKKQIEENYDRKSQTSVLKVAVKCGIEVTYQVKYIDGKSFRNRNVNKFIYIQNYQPASRTLILAFHPIN